ncbi:hypothetical protein PLICRDRAFT_47425 [Plicaturopsis crispa FD-325 SS-3]|uniref:Uncharacterized protein n=1 Tax=Plicaturopsis crispa FD-325 SS-3 TaxID=944288 RepID=A0A0C9T4M6_PLICR|nr:hypothetical protein PLICRDRAFT_47425 [Plicaturopsis crispa FD-325 SS-3]
MKRDAQNENARNQNVDSPVQPRTRLHKGSRTVMDATLDGASDLQRIRQVLEGDPFIVKVGSHNAECACGMSIPLNRKETHRILQLWTSHLQAEHEIDQEYPQEGRQNVQLEEPESGGAPRGSKNNSKKEERPRRRAGNSGNAGGPPGENANGRARYPEKIHDRLKSTQKEQSEQLDNTSDHAYPTGKLPHGIIVVVDNVVQKQGAEATPGGGAAPENKLSDEIRAVLAARARGHRSDAGNVRPIQPPGKERGPGSTLPTHAGAANRSALTDRDDNGVEWHLDEEDGCWSITKHSNGGRLPVSCERSKARV